MQVHWIKDIDRFQSIAQEWDEALISSRADNPFLLSDFIITWWRYHSKNRKLMIFILYEQNRIIAGIPLCLEKRSFRRTLVHIGGINANITHFFSISNGLHFMKCLVHALRDAPEWEIFALDRILANNLFLKQFEKEGGSVPNEFSSYIFDAGFNGIIDLKFGYEAILRRLSQRLRRYIIRSKCKIGEIKLNRIGGRSNIVGLFKEYRDLSIRAFRERKEVSAFESEKNSAFFAELLLKLYDKQRLDAHKLSAGLNTLGISFGYRFGKGFKWILTTFNHDFWRLRPGHLLIDALVKEAIENNDDYFDMYYGGELFYKRQWCTDFIPLKQLIICRNNILNKTIISSEKAFRSNRILMKSAKRLRRLFCNSYRNHM